MLVLILITPKILSPYNFLSSVKCFSQQHGYCTAGPEEENVFFYLNICNIDLQKKKVSLFLSAHTWKSEVSHRATQLLKDTSDNRLAATTMKCDSLDANMSPNILYMCYKVTTNFRGN